MILFTNNVENYVENYVENSEMPCYDWVLYVENSEKTIISTLHNYMLQKQHNYKPPKTCTGTKAGTGTGATAQRQKEDKNVVRSCYAMIQTNKAFYIIFIIAICRIDTKQAK